MVRLQAAMGAERVRGCPHATRTFRPHLETGHRAL